eukprot:scaffold3341_cov165-Ochromonas_danica.AAC.21
MQSNNQNIPVNPTTTPKSSTTSTTTTTTKSTKKKVKKLFPGLEKTIGLGLSDRWQEVEGGGYLLYPPEHVPPVAIIHFIGDAFVGSAPQGVGMLDQVPPLVQVLASSSSTTSNFSPTPLHTKEVLRLMYRCPQTFIVAFAGDAFAKESLSLVQLLQEANTLFKMKKSNRPRQDMIVSHLILPGGRMTPCSQSIFVDLLKLFPLYNNSSTSVTGKTPKIADDRKQANSNSSQSVLEQILKFLPETYDRLVQTFDTSYLSQVEAVADQLGLFMNDIASAVPGSLEERKEEIAAWQAATREAVQERLTKLKAARIERTTSALQSQQSSPATASTNAVASRSVSSSRSSTLSSPPLAVIQDVPGDEVGLREALGESKASSRPVKKTKKQKKRDSTFSSMLLRAHAASTSGLQKAQSSLTAALVLLAGFAQLALLQVASVATWVGQIIMEKLQPSFANLASFSKEFLKESSGKTWQFLSAQVNSVQFSASTAQRKVSNELILIFRNLSVWWKAAPWQLWTMGTLANILQHLIIVFFLRYAVPLRVR